MTYRNTIHKFHRSPNEQIHTVLSEHDSKLLVDIRTYYLAPDDTYKPTRKGISIDPEFIPLLVEALQKLQHTISEDFK